MIQPYETPFWKPLRDLYGALAKVGARGIGLSLMCSELRSRRPSQSSEHFVERGDLRRAQNTS
ncbi:hypothetical protein SAMN02927921_01689 [Sinomicrobium oceani]|uniref:Uncharacterized protein n=1 Tax=Sinomicrobium oceani TaxID=1150368 RepID=A0A1K1P919_9FLAO|nr:hypothetical protein [Sinomicrobium oceani]SFW43949.1 hypothetical protein SAMN02927921_01689 [Sinomicrobium oceani]